MDAESGEGMAGFQGIRMSSIDSQNVFGSVEALPKQLIHAFAEAQKTKVPAATYDQLICCGMGGSGLGARFIETVYADRLQIPLIQVHGYQLPAFVQKKSLVICSSYSGTTEEVLANFDEAKKRGTTLLAIAAGGSLLEKAEEAKIPFYKIEPKHNPSNQPRMAVGYSIMGQLVMAAKAGLLSLSKEEVDEAVAAMERVQEKKEEIIALAKQLKGKIILFGAAEHLIGPMHTTNNQFNENAKTLTFDFQVPEMNHHLLEGTKYPASNKEDCAFLLFDSPSYDERNRKRIAVTAEIAEQNGIKTIKHVVEKGSRLAEGFSLIQFGAYLNWALAMEYGQDPAPIPFVDQFKKRLTKR